MNAISNKNQKWRESLKDRTPAQQVLMAVRWTGLSTHQKGCFPLTQSATQP